jgi:hypothetical protein
MPWRAGTRQHQPVVSATFGTAFVYVSRKRIIRNQRYALLSCGVNILRLYHVTSYFTVLREIVQIFGTFAISIHDKLKV